MDKHRICVRRWYCKNVDKKCCDLKLDCENFMEKENECYIIWNEEGLRECMTNHKSNLDCDLNYEEFENGKS